MKKIVMFAACATMVAASATAQMSVVKEVAKAASSNKTEVLKEALEDIKPALTNAESMNEAQTWYVAGKAAFGLFDQNNANKLIGKDFSADDMAEGLYKGFEYMQRALPLDAVPELDKNGNQKTEKDGTPKFKYKYTKDIVSALIGHQGDIAGLGDACLNAEDWAGAAKAYGYYCDFISSDVARKHNASLPADTVIGNVRFLQGYSFYNCKDYENALPQFRKALDLGYTGNNCKGFLNDTFIRVVQSKLEADDSKGAMDFIDKAIADDPANPIFHDIKGQVFLQNEKIDEAIAEFKTALDKDPNYIDAYFNSGKALYLKAQDYINKNTDKTDKELKPVIIPIYAQATPYLKKAQELSNENTESIKEQAQRILDDIDYKLELLGEKK